MPKAASICAWADWLEKKHKHAAAIKTNFFTSSSGISGLDAAGWRLEARCG
jgi:hypothetical protein